MSFISEVRIFPLKREHPRVKANASFLVGDKLRIKATVLQGQKGLYVGLPGRQGDKTDENGRKVWYDDVAPISKEARKELTDAILSAYKEEVGSDEAPGPTNQDNIPFG